MRNVKRFLRYFCGSIGQCVVFSVLFFAMLLCVIRILLASTAEITGWLLMGLYICIPAVCAYGYCFLTHRKSFHFRLLRPQPKGRAFRLAVRFLAVLVFLLCVYIIDIYHIKFDLGWFHIFGSYGSMLVSAVTYTLFYLFIVIFPVTYALLEYLCVEDIEKEELRSEGNE